MRGVDNQNCSFELVLSSDGLPPFWNSDALNAFTEFFKKLINVVKYAPELSFKRPKFNKRETVWVTNTLDSNVVIEFSWNQEWIVDIRKKKTQEGTLSAAVSPGVVEPKAGVSQGQEKQLHFEHNL